MESNFTMYLYNAWFPDWFTKIKKFFRSRLQILWNGVLFLSDQRQTVYTEYLDAELPRLRHG